VFLYLILNLRNKKLYVGKTEKPLIIRWQNHTANARMGSSLHLHCAIRKYGEESFVMLKLDTAKTAEELSQKEIQMIAELNTQNPKYGYNMTAGGEGISGWIHSEDARQKMRTARSKYTHSPEIYAKIAESNRGRKRSPEVCARIGEIHRGLKMSDESKEKMRQAKLGKKRPPRSPEYCENIRRAKLGHTVSEETRAKISATLKQRNQKTMTVGE
jgi:group I intron endonuclease